MEWMLHILLCGMLIGLGFLIALFVFSYDEFLKEQRTYRLSKYRRKVKKLEKLLEES